MTYKTEIEKAIVDHFMSQEMVDFYDIIKTSETVSERKPIASVFPLNRLVLNCALIGIIQIRAYRWLPIFGRTVLLVYLLYKYRTML